MNARINHKHITQWQKPFRDGIAHYNGKIRNCKRWRNRRKAQKQYNNRMWRNIKKRI